MTTPIFGDFLRPAAEHISAAVFGADDLRDDAERAAIRELGRASATLARYFADLIPPEESGPPCDDIAVAISSPSRVLAALHHTPPATRHETQRWPSPETQVPLPGARPGDTWVQRML